MGIGTTTKVELPGENPGILAAPPEWSATTLPTIAFGHSVAVTPLTLTRAYAAIANGGMLLRPRIVSKLLDADGRTRYAYRTEVEGRAMSAQTAAILRKYLRTAVVRGTGNPTAQVPGYTTAGKTGTAQVVENGSYAPGKYIASFIGFIPAEHPRYVILVKIEQPRGAIYGSVVAAPVFAAIGRAAMLHAGFMPAAPARRGKGGVADIGDDLAAAVDDQSGERRLPVEAGEFAAEHAFQVLHEHQLHGGRQGLSNRITGAGAWETRGSRQSRAQVASSVQPGQKARTSTCTLGAAT